MTARDLLVLTADLDATVSMETLLSRAPALGIRTLDVKVLRHPGRDPACRLVAQGFLRPFRLRFAHALVVFDRDGCGDERDRCAVESAVETRLFANGWGPDAAAAIAVQPELEAWIWTTSAHLDRALGWTGRQPDLRHWLAGRGVFPSGSHKPADPKAAMLAALRAAGRQRSPDVFREIAETCPLSGCVDPAFDKLTRTLRKWFA